MTPEELGMSADSLTPEARALLIGLTFPITNTNGEAEAMSRMIAEHIRAAVAEEKEACAVTALSLTGPLGLVDDIAAAIRARSLPSCP